MILAALIFLGLIALMTWLVIRLQTMRRSYPKVEDLPQEWEE